MKTVWILCISLLAAACSKEPGAEQPSSAIPPAAPAPANPGEKPAPAPPGNRVVHSSPYSAVRVNESPAQPGAPAQLPVRIIPAAGYKMNADYPLRLEVAGHDAVNFANLKLTASDIRDKSAAEWEIPITYTPKTPGEHKTRAKLKYSVCNPESCIPETAEFDVILAAR
ncbi:MAG: hypothetical protein GMKNLPBB_00557 [Myxococcota bacterium]|nr:hypothetical protein [Myxococcota bacterium]